MKKFIILLISFLCCCSSVFAAPPFNQVIFFGDSLSDDGNLYRLFLKIVPKSPPYFKGRFSNGPTWAESVNEYFYNKYYVNTKNYAYGGATAILHFPSIRFVAPTNLELEVNHYFFDFLLKDKSKTLYSIWIGGNDYLYDLSSNEGELTSLVVDRITWALNKLYSHGGRSFIVLNLPDLGSTPYSRAHRTTKRMHLLSELHNKKLAVAVANFQKVHPDTKLIFVDIYDMFNEVLTNPDVYNQKYHVNIKNTAESCWQGGMLLRDDELAAELKKDLAEAKWSQNKIDLMPGEESNFSMNSIMDMILKSPPIEQAYTLGKLFDRGYVPCENAHEYLFWDQMHPTAVVHKVLAQMVLERIHTVMQA